MPEGLLNSSVVTQVGIVVRDVEKSAKQFAEFLGAPVPKWAWTDGVEKAHTIHRGRSTPARAKLAFLKVGPQVDIELIEPDASPSTWREFLDEHGEGVHHIAFVINGMAEQVRVIEKAGYPLVQKGDYTGGRYAYMDTSSTLKTILELLENDPR